MSGFKKLDNEQTAYFCEQLSLMVNTGMQIDDGLEILSEDIVNSRTKALCSFLAEKVGMGDTLSSAMKESGAFPEYAEKMAEIGCVTGRLDDVLKGLAEYYENRAEMQRSIRYAVFHPVMLLLMMTIVVVVLVVKIIPMFSDIFAQFDANIGSTVADAVSLANAAGGTVLIILLVLIVLLAVILFIPPVKKAMLALFSVLPVTRGISMCFAEAKLADAMSLMITSGLDPEDALEYSMELITDKKLKAKLADCLKRVQGGEYFSDAVCSAGILPKIYSRSLKIAYTSGSFDEVWRKISRRTGDTAQRTLSNLVSMVEPAIIVVLAVMIGSILLTIMLPLMNIMSALG